jgi:hypothetical protein
MSTQWLNTATRYLWRSVTEGGRNVLTLRERYRAIKGARDTRGIALLREWLSPMQRAQFDASKSFDVVGCDSGRRYRILYGRVTNVHEIGQPVTGWCFVPSGHLVAGDVLLTQKIALETNERATLAVTNRFNVQVPPHSPDARTPLEVYHVAMQNSAGCFTAQSPTTI